MKTTLNVRSMAGRLAKPGAVTVFMMLGIFAGLGLRWSDPQPEASAATDSCENAICVPAGDAAQWRAGNLILNTGGSYANGLLVPYGNTGLGVINPQAKLDVLGNTILGGKVLIGSSSSASSLESSPYALSVTGQTSLEDVTAKKLCLGGTCISSWNDLKNTVSTTGSTGGSGTDMKACGSFFITDPNKDKNCMDSPNLSQVKTSCCPKGTISACTITQVSTGGDNVSIKGTNCDLPADPPKVGTFGPVQQGGEKWVPYSYFLLAGSFTPAQVGAQCYADKTGYKGTPVSSPTAVNNNLICDTKDPDPFKLCNEHCCMKGTEYTQKCNY